MLQHALQRELYLKVHRGDGSNPGWYNSLVQSIVVGVRNDQILEVTALKFKSGVSFGVGSNLQLPRGGVNFVTSVPHMGRLLL